MRGAHDASGRQMQVTKKTPCEQARRSNRTCIQLHA
jgi:hypothetical protein